jgi:hypothetical protein
MVQTIFSLFLQVRKLAQTLSDTGGLLISESMQEKVPPLVSERTGRGKTGAPCPHYLDRTQDLGSCPISTRFGSFSMDTECHTVEEKTGKAT